MEQVYDAYRVFTITSPKIEDGADVEKFSIQNGDVTIDAIVVGEKGRNRTLGVISVSGAPVSGERVMRCASVGRAKSGNPKLFWADAPTTDSHIIAVLRTGLGFRGGNSHSGDRKLVRCDYIGKTGYGKCPACGLDREGSAPHPETNPDGSPCLMPRFEPVPGDILARGTVAQGGAGAMGSGEQLVILLPLNGVLRVQKTGRLYGEEGVHYFMWNGSSLMCATRQQRDITGAF